MNDLGLADKDVEVDGLDSCGTLDEVAGGVQVRTEVRIQHHTCSRPAALSDGGVLAELRGEVVGID